MEYYIPYGKVVSTKTRPWFNHECSHAVAQDQAPYQAWARASAYGDPAVDRLKAAYNKAATAAEIFYDDGSLHSHLWLREYIYIEEWCPRGASFTRHPESQYTRYSCF